MTTAIIHHQIFYQHDTGPGHPETPSRYKVVMDALKNDAALWSSLREVQAREAPRGDIQAAHSPQHYKHVERAVSEGIGYLDADTIVSMRSLDAAKHAAGAPCQAIDLIMSGEVQNAFLPHVTRSNAIRRSNALRSLIGMFITATARRESSTTIQQSISSRRTSIRGTPEPERVARKELAEVLVTR
jgi:hypothetical protein